jgi:uncharacterized membrane protein
VELILSGMYMCGYSDEGYNRLLAIMILILHTVWGVLALSLLIWIAIKHFRDLQRLGPLAVSPIGGCFRVLIKSQVLYFSR